MLPEVTIANALEKISHHLYVQNKLKAFELELETMSEFDHGRLRRIKDEMYDSKFRPVLMSDPYNV